MRIEEFIDKYDLHDSLVEQVENINEQLIFNIELCNWRQKDYSPKDDEMKSLKLVFNNVKDYTLDATTSEFDSDTILEFTCLHEGGSFEMHNIKFVIEGEGDIKIIEFKSDTVDVDII